mmetsp:Transcript_3071/g.5881  ORF Transcript_3071/g.5881 Transcript_3071/m.5881 type:complete len:146 (-) Transcript_3071:617-1054(-)
MPRKKGFKNNNKTEANIAVLAEQVAQLEALAVGVREQIHEINPNTVNAIRRKNQQRSVLGMGPELAHSKKGTTNGVFEASARLEDAVDASSNNSKHLKKHPAVRKQRSGRSRAQTTTKLKQKKSKKHRSKGKLLKGSGKVVHVDV